MARSSWPSSRRVRRPARPNAERRRIGDALRHPLAITAVGALVAGWLLPPFAHQWQDRQKERELKREIVTQLDQDATTAVIGALFLMNRSSPESYTVDVRKDALDLRPATPRLQGMYDAAVEAERNAGTARLSRIVSEWYVTRSVIRSTLDAYFPNSAVGRRWSRQFSVRVSDFLFLASSRLERPARRQQLARLAEYLEAPPDTWKPLEIAPGPMTPKERDEYAAAAGRLAGTLLLRKNEIVQEILTTHAEGFSTRPGDLLRDLVPVLG